jgi:alkanesulfonate monooxygenase SsuD/methylene tetrahydromethanopterin reductase-like flavin-dependent oxidoreductase (luciferase family)
LGLTAPPCHDPRVSTASPSLQVGLNLPTWPLRDRSYATWPQIRSLARDAEAVGIDTLWAPDHLRRELPGGERIGFWECWTILTAAAEATTSIGIGPYVACTGYRNPALLAKMAMTLDEVSGGRLVLGLGSGVPDRDPSWHTFGFAADKPVGRYAEAAEIVTRMLRERSVTYEGEFYRTDDAELIPRGPRPDGPPVWLAGLGERTARIAARFGDAINVNLPLAGPGDMARLVEIAHRACKAEGRDPTTLALTGWGRVVLDDDGIALERPGCLSGSPEEVAAMVRGFEAAGLRHMTFYIGAPDDPSKLPALTAERLEAFAPVLRAIRGA